MKQLLTSLLFLLVGTQLMAQTYSVKGVVCSEANNEPMEYAVVALLKGDSIQKTTITKAKGDFLLSNVHKGQFDLRVSYVGCPPKKIPLKVEGKNNVIVVDTIRLSNDELLGTAEITGTVAKVEQKEDTTVFNAAAYRVPEGSTLGALIKQIPGVEVDDNGAIKVNGQQVTEFLINGKDFFKGDTEIAMKNLPTTLVSKIKSYKKKSDYTEMTGIDDGEETQVLDISTKRELNQTLVSNIDLAYGTKDRYSTKAFVNYFTDHARITAFGSANNIGDRGYGGRGGGSGIRNVKNGGVDFSWENGKEKREAGRVEIGGNARYSHSDSYSRSTRSNETFLTGTNKNRSFSNSASNSSSCSGNFNASFRVRWNPDTLTMIMFRPSFSHSKGENDSQSSSATFNDDPYKVGEEEFENPLDSIFADSRTPLGVIRPELLAIAVNRNLSQSMGDNESTNINGTLNLTRRFGSEGRNFSIRFNGGYSESKNNSFSLSEIVYYKNGTPNGDPTFKNQYSTTPGKNYNYSVRTSYAEPLGNDWFAEARYDYSFRYNESNRSRYNLEKYNDGNSEYSSYLTSLPIFGTVPNDADLLMQARDDYNSQYATYKYNDHNINLGVRYNTKEIRFNAGVDLKPQHTTLDYSRPSQIDTVVTRDVFNWAPSVRLRYRFNTTTNLDINYRGNTSEPSMTNLLEVVDDSNPLSVSMGNAGLEPSWNHNLNVHFNTYNAEAQRGIFTGFGGSMRQNSISNRVVYDTESGRRFSRPENINGNWNVWGNFGFNTGLGEEKLWTISTNTNASFNNNVGYISTNTTGIAAPAPGANMLEYYRNIFATAEAMKNKTQTLNLSENLRLNYRATYWDFGVYGNVNYQHSKYNVQANSNPDTWNFDYGAHLNIRSDFGLAFSTDFRVNSRRGYSAANMNTNELLWNAQISHSFLKNKAATLSLQFYDILHEQSSISRTIDALQRSDSWTYGIHSYCMVHFIYKLNIFGGTKGGGEEKGKNNEKGQRGMPGNFGGGRPQMMMMPGMRF
jgi:hypothetical protein